MKTTIICDCSDCQQKNDTHHRLTIRKSHEDGKYHARGHGGIDEVIEGARDADDIGIMYDSAVWDLRYE